MSADGVPDCVAADLVSDDVGDDDADIDDAGDTESDEPVEADDVADADSAAVDDAPLPADWQAARTIDLEVEGEPVRVEYHGQASVFARRGGLTFDLHGPTVSPTGFRAHLTTYADVAEQGSPEAAAQHIAHTLHAEYQAFLVKNRRSWPLDLPDRVEVKIGETVSYARPISWSQANQRWEMWLIGAGEGRTVKPDQILTAAQPSKKHRAKSRTALALPRTAMGAPVTVPAGWQQPLNFEFTLDGQPIRVEYHGSRSLGFQTGQLQFGFFGQALSHTGFYNIFAAYAEVAHCGNPEMAAIELARMALHSLTGSTEAASPAADSEAEFEAEPADDRPAADRAPDPVMLTQPPVLWKQPKFYPAVRGDQTVIVVARNVDDVQAEVQAGTVLLNSVGFDSRPEAVAWLDQQAVKPEPRAALPAGLAERLTAVRWRELKADRTGHADFFESWHDDVLMLMRPNHQPGTPWVACYATPEGEWVALSRTASADDRVQGATLFEALDALREQLAAWQIPTPVFLRPGHPGWTSAIVGELTAVVQTHERVLIADTDLGVPTIHDLPHPEHKGFGFFVSATDEYTVNWDAGGAMQRLSNHLGWTTVQVERGTYPYDQAAVLALLNRWQSELVALEQASATPVQPAAEIDQHAVCSHCHDLFADVQQALRAGWVVDAPYLFCAKCAAAGVHAPSRTAGSDLAVTDVLAVPDYLPTAYARAEWQRTLDAFESARGKEPWQMTRDEFFATHRPFSDGAQHHTLLQLIVNHEFDVMNTLVGNESVSAHILQLAVDYLDRLRATLVQIALAESKPVPAEVLREYPDRVAAQRKRNAGQSASDAHEPVVLDQRDEPVAEIAADESVSLQPIQSNVAAAAKTPAKKSRKKAPVMPAPALVIPTVWHDPADFGIEVEGEEALVHYDGRDSTGFDHGSVWFEFRGPNISSTGYRSHFHNLTGENLSSTPQQVAREIARQLAHDLAAEVKKAKKKWPLKPVEDMAVQIEGTARRAKLISWNDFNKWWNVWLRRERESATVGNDAVLGEWTTYFAAHLNPGDHVVYRSVSTILHAQVVRVVPGSACVVEVQQPNVARTNLVSPGDLIGLWDELSPAERGEKFEIPTFGLARNPFDMERALFDEWVLAVDPLHGVEWSQAYRYFAEGYALSDDGWMFFENNPHFIEKRQSIDPHLIGNPFDAPRDQFVRWVQAQVDGTEAQAAYLQGYVHLSTGRAEVMLPDTAAYLATQPLYTAALAARNAAAQPLDPHVEAVGVLASSKVAQVEAAGYRFVFGEMAEAAKNALVGLGAGRGGKLDMLRARGLTVEQCRARWTQPCLPLRRNRSAVSVPTVRFPAVETLCCFNTAVEWAAWHERNRSDVSWFVPPESLNSPLEVKVGLTADRLKVYLRRGARIEFRNMSGDPLVGEFEKWQRNGAALIKQFNAQHEAVGSFSVSLDRFDLVTLDFSDAAKPDRAAAKSAPVAKPTVTQPPVVKRPTGLPADVPEVIEVDVGGRKPVWVLATIIKVTGPQLTCQRQDDHSTLKTPIYGRDIAWRVPSLAETPLAA